jgi:quercetin dioxygenase-like cupin family protein
MELCVNAQDRYYPPSPSKRKENDETDDTAGGTRSDCPALAVGTALATPPSGQTVTPLTKGTLGTFTAEGNGIEVQSKKSSADIAIAKVDLAPGGSTGWHHLPGLTLVSVASGTVTVYDVNCGKIVATAGEGFVEHRNEPRLVKNNGNVDAILYTTLLAPTDLLALPFEEVRSDDPQPTNCNVTSTSSPTASASASATATPTASASSSASALPESGGAFSLIPLAALALLMVGTGVLAFRVVRRS